MATYDIKEDGWEAIYQVLLSIKGIRVSNKAKTRKFIEAVHYILRTGAQWRYLPGWFGKAKTVHKRYFAWCQKGIWEQVLSFLSWDYDSEYLMVDATIVRAHACAAGYAMGQQEAHALGRSKGGFSTKIHGVVDGLGQGIRFALTGGQRHDITQANALIDSLTARHIIADKGYDSNAFVDQIAEQGAQAIIPSKRNRKEERDYDRHIYKERHLIECFFGKLKQFRRVFSRFDKHLLAFLAFVSFASALIWLR